MPRPLSDSWQYFELLSPDNGRSRKARCTFCGHEQAAGITRLHQHLLYRCSRISSDIRDQLRQKQDDRGRDSPPKGNELVQHNNNQICHQQQQPHQESVDYHFDSALQNTLNNNHSSPSNMNPHSTYYEAALSPTTSTNFSSANPIAFPSSTPTTSTATPTALGQQQQERSQAILDFQLARALFSAKIPFESIENPHMIDFLKRLQPNYIVPKGRRLQQYLLKEQHWDLIQWDNESDLILSRSTNQQPTVIHSPPPPLPSMLQQQQCRMMLSSDASNNNGNNNNNNNSPNTMGNRLLSSLHPADLEGSL